MSNELELFRYGDIPVRVVILDGEPWFVAKDVTDLLGFSNGSGAVRDHVLPGQRRSERIATPGAVPFQNMTVISEAGLYRLIMRSNVPGAERFQDWVTGEVLPAIRKTGSYNSAPALTGSDLLAAAVLEAQSMIAAKEQRIAELEPQVLQLTEKVQADATKVNYIETFVSDDDLLLLRDVASTLGVGEKWLRELLIGVKWIYVERDRRWSKSKWKWEPQARYSEYAHKKHYFRRVKDHRIPKFRGEVMHTLFITPPGAEAIARLVERECATCTSVQRGGDEFSQ